MLGFLRMEFCVCFVKDSEKYVEELLSLFNRFSKLIENAFHDDPRFLTARDKAYKKVVNDISVFKLDFPSNKARYKGVQLKANCGLVVC